MKNIILLFIALLMFAIINPSYSQEATETKTVAMDTIVTKKNVSLIGKITKISETEIEYKKVNSLDAPVYSVTKDKLKEIRWANGTKEKIVAEEMDINKEQEIIDRRLALKFHFFSPINDQLTFTYERSLKVGTNLEVSAGLINNSMIKNSFNSGSNLTQGGLLIVGVKFLLGQDYYIKGMKYTHPLKGRYLKPEIAFSSYTIRSLSRPINNYYSYSSYGPVPLIYSDRKITSVAVMINYGRQYILGNIMTFGYSVGVGYSFVDSKYSNSSFVQKNTQNGYYGYEDRTPTNLFTHFRTGNTPIAFNGTITLGYIFK